MLWLLEGTVKFSIKEKIMIVYLTHLHRTSWTVNAQHCTNREDLSKCCGLSASEAQKESWEEPQTYVWNLWNRWSACWGSAAGSPSRRCSWRGSWWWPRPPPPLSHPLSPSSDHHLQDRAEAGLKIRNGTSGFHVGMKSFTATKGGTSASEPRTLGPPPAARGAVRSSVIGIEEGGLLSHRETPKIPFLSQQTCQITLKEQLCKKHLSFGADRLQGISHYSLCVISRCY